MTSSSNHAPKGQKKAVSAGSIFKQRTTKDFLIKKMPLSAAKQKTDTTYGVPTAALSCAKAHHNPRSTPEAVAKVSKDRTASHTLALEYNIASNDYRHHVYSATSTKIVQTLEDLLGNLHKNQPSLSLDNNHSGVDEPLRLTLSDKLQQEAAKLYMPISQFRLERKRIKSDGSHEQVLCTVEQRISNYEEHMKERKAHAEKLIRTWEIMVGEIWKLGVRVLGQETMESLMYTDISAIASPSDRPETSLLVGEHESNARTQKHVTFDTKEQDEQKTGPQSHSFLHQPSRWRGEPVPVNAALSRRSVTELRKEVDDLGSKHLEELHQAEQQNHSFWKKKKEQIALALVTD